MQRNLQSNFSIHLNFILENDVLHSQPQNVNYEEILTAGFLMQKLGTIYH